MIYWFSLKWAICRWKEFHLHCRCCFQAVQRWLKEWVVLWQTVSSLQNSNAKKLWENIGLPNIILNKEQPEFVLFLENETLVQTRMALYRSHGELFLLAMKCLHSLSRACQETLCYAQHIICLITARKVLQDLPLVPVVSRAFHRDHPTTVAASSSMAEPLFSSLLLSEQCLLTSARFDNQGSTSVMSSLFEVW